MGIQWYMAVIFCLRKNLKSSSNFQIKGYTYVYMQTYFEEFAKWCPAWTKYLLMVHALLDVYI